MALENEAIVEVTPAPDENNELEDGTNNDLYDSTQSLNIQVSPYGEFTCNGSTTTGHIIHSEGILFSRVNFIDEV